MARISDLLRADYDSPEGKELDPITDLVMEYEDKHHPIGDPDPHSMLDFMPDQEMVTREQLIPLAGSVGYGNCYGWKEWYNQRVGAHYVGSQKEDASGVLETIP